MAAFLPPCAFYGGMDTTAAAPCEHAAIATRLNGVLVGVVVLTHLFVLVALPLLLMHSMLWAVLLVPLALLNSPHWALMHEAIHKLLHPDAAVNDRYGRALGVLMGASFHVLRFGHLMHHQLNRQWHSEWVQQKDPQSRTRYYGNLLFGLYGAEVLASLLVACLPGRFALALASRTAFRDHPQAAQAAERFFYARRHAALVRGDMAMSLVIYAAAFWHYGMFWPVLVLFFVLRGLVISLLDNIYHYATPEDNSKAGKELLLHPLASRFLLHANYHETHHLNPQVPWCALPETHHAQGRPYSGYFFEHGLRQFAGPLQRRLGKPQPA